MIVNVQIVYESNCVSRYISNEIGKLLLLTKASHLGNAKVCVDLQFLKLYLKFANLANLKPIFFIIIMLYTIPSSRY